MPNYVAYHVHSDLSLLDSCTNFKAYVDRAVELGQTAIASTEHGKPLQWIEKKMYCDQKGIKFLFGVEAYLTRDLFQRDPKTGESHKVRDNYHTILIARDYAGLQEINRAITISTDENHTYYANRLTFQEFCNLSDHVITTSACLASPLNKLSLSDPWYEKLLQRYDFLEIQPHNCPEQIQFNQTLAILARRYRKPLIAATDAHSLNAYKAECRSLLMDAKNQHYEGEDAMDLTYKSYDELVAAFQLQNALPKALCLEAIENTNLLADMVQDFDLDLALKYPKLYGSSEADREKLTETTYRKFHDKLSSGVIPQSEKEGFESSLQEELRVFEKIDMSGYILCMSELVSWCWEHDIPIGPARGSVGGSRVAYVTDIIDLDPERWHTVFSRFANEDRREVGDIDIDCIDTDRPKIFEYLINRFGRDYTARVPTWGTAEAAATIELIFRGLRNRWEVSHGGDGKKISPENPYQIKACDAVKQEYEQSPEAAREKHPDIFYYFDGIFGTKTNQSVHAAGMVVSPVTLPDNYGCFWKDGELVLDIDMEEIHEVSLVKFDLLVLNTIGIIQDACELAGIPYPKSHLMDFDDPKVWADMMRSPIGIFQMEKPASFRMLREYGTKSIFDMSLVTACIRPSGASYRDDLLAHKPHKNPSPLIDELLKDNNGYLVYQCDTIKFLQQICGLSGSEADNIRRAIGRKDKARLEKALPAILDGYCAKSPQPREVAEQEAKEFIQILEDSASYQFGYNHSIAYCLVGYYCAYLRCYYPGPFITAYLRHPKKEEDVLNGTELAKLYGIPISPVRYELSDANYTWDSTSGVIAKGLSSIKGYGQAICEKLHEAGQKHRAYFVEALSDLDAVSIKSATVAPLIKIDYFRSFGNTVELARILEAFDLLKQGHAAKVSKEKIAETWLEPLVRECATGTNAKGVELKSWTITDMPRLLRGVEETIKAAKLPDVDDRVKIQNQQDILGYVDLVSGKTEDRRRLLVTDVYCLKSKQTGQAWGYALQTRSIGTGKTARLTVYSDLYRKTPIQPMDIIYASGVRKKRDYWYLTSYSLVVGNSASGAPK